MKSKTYTRIASDRQYLCLQVLFLVCFFMLLMLVSVQTRAQEEVGGEIGLTNNADVSYRLGAGDRLQIDVFNQDDLSGEYTLDGEGRISMHLIGQIKAEGLSAMELSELLISKLKPDYLVNPRISVQVKSFRPYYLIGEVRSVGPFAYVDGITYLTAVAIAGGFTYRAKKDNVYVVRADDSEREELKLDIGEKVQPGDIIRVAERIF